MQIFLFLTFIAVPIIEIALFIEAGRVIGLLPTILITIGTAIAGSFLMRVQGFATLSRFSQAVEKGEMPVTPVVDGIGILSAGLLLLTPGLFTDAIGLLLFVPPVRRGIAKWLFGQALKRGTVKFRSFNRGDASPPRSGGAAPRDTGFKKSDDIIDAEFETIEPQDKTGNREENSRHGKKDSPWQKE